MSTTPLAQSKDEKRVLGSAAADYAKLGIVETSFFRGLARHFSEIGPAVTMR